MCANGERTTISCPDFRIMDTGILTEILAESLLATRQGLLQLESNPADPEALDACCRTFQTIIDSANALGAHSLLAWCRNLDGLVDGLRRSALPVDDVTIGILRRCIDFVEQLSETVARGNPPAPAPPELAESIQSLVRGLGEGASELLVGHMGALALDESAEGASARRDTIRVESSRLDRAMSQVGELVLLRNRLTAAVTAMSPGDENLVRLARETDLAVDDLQSTVMYLRMQPSRRLFQRLPQVVRDLSVQYGKRARLVLEGGDVEIDKVMIEALAEPLLALVRNALEHGLECPRERAAVGKTEVGEVRVTAEHLGDKVRIEVSDDGRGVDPQRVLSIVLARRVICQADAQRLNQEELLNLIFEEGARPSDEAGGTDRRGVGLARIRRVIQSLRGRVQIKSNSAAGACVSIELPVSLAVLPVLYFKLRRETYALPVSLVDNLIEVEPGHLHNVSGRAMVQIAPGNTVPYIDLGQRLHGVALRPGRDSCEGILTEHGLLVVSAAVGIEDSVVKPLDIAHRESWYQGATISGEGEVVLILDVPALVHSLRAGDAA